MTTYPADAIEAAARAYYVEIAASDGVPENEAIAMWERDELSDFKDGIVRRARACVAAFDAAMLAHGWKRCPRQCTDEMWSGLARDIMMWLDMHNGSEKTPRNLFKHLERIGRDIPDWLRNEPEMTHLDHVPSKGTRAAIIHKAMYDAAPEVKP